MITPRLALIALLAITVPLALRSAEAPPQEDNKNLKAQMGKVPFTMGYENGLKKAEKAKKPMMLFLTAGNLPRIPGLKGMSMIFTDPKVLEAVQDFQPVLVDFSSEASDKALKFTTDMKDFPRVEFWALDGKEPLSKFALNGGTVSVEKFLEKVAEAKKNLAPKPPEKKAGKKGK